MTFVRVKGFQIFKDRHGRMRCYHRVSGTPIDLEKHQLGSLQFFAECARIAALAKKGDVAKPGTLGLLINQYRAHAEFADLAPRTRADYQKCFDYLYPIKDTPLSRFTSPLIVKIRDKAGEVRGRRFGTYVKTTLSLLFSWGKERGYVSDNPAFRIRGIRRPKNAPEANRPWSDAERETVLEALPTQMILPATIMMFCGLDPGDTLKLPRTAILEGCIDTRRGKTKEPVWLPLPQPVKEALANAPLHDAITVCANSKGRPWTTTGFASSWFPIRKRLEHQGLIGPGLTYKGLRHTVATILAEMGYDERTIADMLGQKTIEMARHYSRRADRTRKLTAVVTNFDVELNRRRTKAVKPT
jgi:integrase